MSFDLLSAASDVSEPTPLAATGLVMVLAVVAFKVAAVPFHGWAPDTYQGATVPVAAYLSVVSKAGGFAALLLVTATFSGWSQVWAPAVAALAVLSMLGGNVMALRQRNAVRLLAWSSIAQAGYILVPIAAVAGSVEWGADVRDSVVGYLAAYAAMNLGAFAVVAAASRRLGAVAISDYRGLCRGAVRGWAWRWRSSSPALAGLPPGLIGLLVKVRRADRARRLRSRVVGSCHGSRHRHRLDLLPDVGCPAVPSAPSPSPVPWTWLRRVSCSPRAHRPLPWGSASSSTVVFSVAPSLALGLVDRL